MLAHKDKTANCHTREKKDDGRRKGASYGNNVFTDVGEEISTAAKKRDLLKLTSLLVPGGGGDGGGEGGGERGNRRHIAVSALRRLEAEPALSISTKYLNNILSR